jgi:hypothetical protein
MEYSTDGATMLAGFNRQLRIITIPAAFQHCRGIIEETIGECSQIL